MFFSSFQWQLQRRRVGFSPRKLPTNYKRGFCSIFFSKTKNFTLTDFCERRHRNNTTFSFLLQMPAPKKFLGRLKMAHHFFFYVSIIIKRFEGGKICISDPIFFNPWYRIFKKIRIFLTTNILSYILTENIKSTRLGYARLFLSYVDLSNFERAKLPEGFYCMSNDSCFFHHNQS